MSLGSILNHSSVERKKFPIFTYEVNSETEKRVE